MNGAKNKEESITFKRIAVIFRYIFLGLICWSFFYSIFSIIRESTFGFIIGLASTIIFAWMSNNIISPGKLNNKEFGRYTNTITFLIQLSTTLLLVLLFGIWS